MILMKNYKIINNKIKNLSIDSDISILIDFFDLPKKETTFLYVSEKVITDYYLNNKNNKLYKNLNYNYFIIKNKLLFGCVAYFVLKRNRNNTFDILYPVFTLNTFCNNINICIDERKVITYDKNKNTIIKYVYYLNRKLHNKIGPAIREYCNNKWHNYFYLYGNLVSLDSFCKEMERNWK